MKSHAGIAGNECAVATAKEQANEANYSVTDIGIPSASPFSQTFWLAKEEKQCYRHVHSSCTRSQILLPSQPSNALKFYMYTNHILGSQNRILLLVSELVITRR
eukprot:1149530-Pelagomonas_calceolata.AAC.4